MRAHPSIPLILSQHKRDPQLFQHLRTQNCRYKTSIRGEGSEDLLEVGLYVVDGVEVQGGEDEGEFMGWGWGEGGVEEMGGEGDGVEREMSEGSGGWIRGEVHWREEYLGG